MKKYVYTKGEERVTVETDGIGSINNFMVTGVIGLKPIGSELVRSGFDVKMGDSTSVASLINLAKKCECDLVVYGDNDKIDSEASQNFTPRLENLQLGVAYDENSYNSVVPESYRQEYDYEASKDSLPWLVMTFNKVDENNTYAPKITMNYGVSEPDTQVTFAKSCEAIGTLSNDDKVLTLDKAKNNYAMFEIKADLQISDGIETNKNFSVNVEYAGENYGANVTVE